MHVFLISLCLCLSYAELFAHDVSTKTLYYKVLALTNKGMVGSPLPQFDLGVGKSKQRLIGPLCKNLYSLNWETTKEH